MARQEAEVQLMHSWLLVLTLVILILASAIVWFAIARRGRTPEGSLSLFWNDRR
jgi:hypothetical protein